MAEYKGISIALAEPVHDLCDACDYRGPLARVAVIHKRLYLCKTCAVMVANGIALLTWKPS